MNVDTLRCNIRLFRKEDIDAFMIYRNDMDWMKYQGFKGLTKEEYTKTLIEGNPSLINGIQFAIICRQTNTLIGDIYLKQEGDSCWIGYTVTPLKARQGYAYEAVSAVICFLAAQGFASAKASVTTGNDASVALLRKLNFSLLFIEEAEQIFELNLI